jgi:hypothetical protein
MKTKILSLISLILFLASCEKDSSNEIKKDNPSPQKIKKSLFTGYVQKGPFINGSTVTIFELDSLLDQTGRAYNSSIADNSGKYEQKNLELSTNFALLKADGFYFNENKSEISSAQLTLYALTDLSGDSTANVNLLTHLERSRIEYLINQNNSSFLDAKKQAQKDVLKIFSIEKSDILNSEKLSLINEGDDNAILLAISIIIQGSRTTSESELLANIITDIKNDGYISDSSLGSKLIEDVKFLDLAKIRSNINKRYQDIGISTNIPNFEKYVKIFIDSTKYKPTKFITYPLKSSYGTNILSDSVTDIA